MSMFYAGKGIQSSGKVLDSGYSKRKKKSIAPTRNHKSVKIQKEIIDFAVNPDTLL